ncbi:MAG: amino acid ABC transporter substrate-binding protein [Rhodocyclaceae bacterium]|nr:amino acid ABC transporter substrate-binding protein [Rhodocyclaceae bacterium]
MIAIAWAAASPYAAAAECIKSVRWWHDPPYSYQAPDGSIAGLSVELTRALLERLGCTPMFVEMPWARGLIELEAGRLDILPGALMTDERAAFAYFSRPTNLSPNVLFMSKRARERFAVQRLADIVGTDFRLGAQIKVNYGPEYAELLPTPGFGARLTFLTDRRGAWRMLEANRLDGLIADQISGLLELKDLGLSETIVPTEVIVSDRPAHIALSKRSVDPVFFERFNKALEAMARDGSLRTIAQRNLPCKVRPTGIGCR